MRRGVLTGFTELTGFLSILPWCVASCMSRQIPAGSSRLWGSCLQGQRCGKMACPQASSWQRFPERNDLTCERSSGPGGGNGPCFFERYSKRIASSSSSVKELPGQLRMPLNLVMSRTFLIFLPFVVVSGNGLFILVVHLCAAGIVAQKGSSVIEKMKGAA